MENVCENFSTNGTDFFGIETSCTIYKIPVNLYCFERKPGTGNPQNFKENLRLKRGKGNTSEGTRISTAMNPTKKVSLKKAFSHSQSARKKILGS